MLINLYINLCQLVNDSVEKRLGKIKLYKYCTIQVNESVVKYSQSEVSAGATGSLGAKE